jgi:sugar phosphate isomerase/epimerase
MKTSTEINSSAKYIGEEKTIELVAKAGFDAWDFSMFQMVKYDWATKSCSESSHPLAGSNYAEFARRLKRIGEDNGIFCNQSHAPFPSACKEIRDMLRRALECTAIAGGKICVIHPCNNLNAEQNAEMFCDLLPFAHEVGVKIATENMWNWDKTADHALPAACSDASSFCEHIEVVNDEFLVACLDIGHAEMRGLNTSAVDMIRALGAKLAALHIHDNDKRHDSHQLPYTMAIDFPPILRALKETGYKGDFTLECDQFIKSAGEVERKLNEMSRTARKMATEFENLSL